MNENIDKEKLLIEIVESNLSSASKVYLIDLVKDSKNQVVKQSIVDENILNPTSSWGKKGEEEYKSQLNYYQPISTAQELISTED